MPWAAGRQASWRSQLRAAQGREREGGEGVGGHWCDFFLLLNYLFKFVIKAVWLYALLSRHKR